MDLNPQEEKGENMLGGVSERRNFCGKLLWTLIWKKQ